MTQQQCFLTSKNPVLITKENSKSFGVKIERCGRPSDRLTNHQIKQAIRIVQFDMEKQGRIMRAKCPQHGTENLTYRYQTSDGVHVWCEICGWTTHFDEIHYQGSDNKAGE
jgi:ribosomal protein S27E